MVREVKLARNDLGRSCQSEIGLSKLWDDPNDAEDVSISANTAISRSENQKSTRRITDDKNLADEDWMNWD